MLVYACVSPTGGSLQVIEKSMGRRPILTGRKPPLLMDFDR